MDERALYQAGALDAKIDRRNGDQSFMEDCLFRYVPRYAWYKGFIGPPDGVRVTLVIEAADHATPYERGYMLGWLRGG